jgi:hypothetical protein
VRHCLYVEILSKNKTEGKREERRKKKEERRNYYITPLKI